MFNLNLKGELRWRVDWERRRVFQAQETAIKSLWGNFRVCREEWDAGKSCENEAGERQGSDHSDPLWHAKVCELILRIRQSVTFFFYVPISLCQIYSLCPWRLTSMDCVTGAPLSFGLYVDLTDERQRQSSESRRRERSRYLFLSPLPTSLWFDSSYTVWSQLLLGGSPSMTLSFLWVPLKPFSPLTPLGLWIIRASYCS